MKQIVEIQRVRQISLLVPMVNVSVCFGVVVSNRG